MGEVHPLPQPVATQATPRKPALYLCKVCMGGNSKPTLASRPPPCPACGGKGEVLR